MPLAAATAIFAVLLLFHAIDALPATRERCRSVHRRRVLAAQFNRADRGAGGHRPVGADGRCARARPQGLARGRRCDPHAGRRARCCRHGRAPQSSRRRAVPQDRERPAGKPGYAQSGPHRGGRPGACRRGAHQRRADRARAGGAARLGNGVAPCAFGGALARRICW